MAETDKDLSIAVIDPTGQGYLYVGSGDHCVLLAEMHVPKWRNATGLTSNNARKLAAALTKMADQSEQVQAKESDND